MTRSGLENFGRSLRRTDGVVFEATGNAMAVVRVLSPYVGRVIFANPTQVKVIAHASIKTDKIDAVVLAQFPSGFLPQVWVPDERTERLRCLVPPPNQVVRHRTRVKSGVHGILQAHLVPKCLHADLFNRRGRAWLERQVPPGNERAASPPHPRDRLAEDLADLDRDIAWEAVDDVQTGSVRRSPASTPSSRAVSSPPSATSGGSAKRRS
ncbi:transposase [Mesorhizobium sp. NZP2234]|uniref:IS110 family transposase n=1 Tax=Mesorhizobium sp. NZP2234 TaxID=2483402 RepID=UPI001FEE01AD|nr:transposase [Mesorhizobium sp. NZP2234]